MKEHPEYGQTAVEWIDENRHPERKEGYDYYYVPSIDPMRAKYIAEKYLQNRKRKVWIR